MRKIFLDCGQFNGVAIQQYCVDDSWDIYSFEPFPMPDLKLPKHELIQKAVWTNDLGLDFNVDPLNQASHVSGIGGTAFPEIRRVPSLDFSQFVGELPPADVVVCSMDIEGAEFVVLRKMLRDGTARTLDVLDVEFHHRLMPDEDADTAKQLIQELSNAGVIVRLKIVLL